MSGKVAVDNLPDAQGKGCSPCNATQFRPYKYVCLGLEGVPQWLEKLQNEVCVFAVVTAYTRAHM